MVTDETNPEESPENGADESEQTSGQTAPRAFISYTHETSEHKAWVASLATDLRRNGVDAVLDQWETRLGSDLTLFMEQGIRTSERVLLICTPTYARKANEGEGGVGYERLVVTGELAENIATEKFICVLRSGSKEESIPSFAKSRLFVDFRNSDSYHDSLEELLRDILNTPAQTKPAIGENPFTSAAENPTPQPPISIGEFQDVTELARGAEQVLRARDMLGWRRLVRNVRRDHQPQLEQWVNSLQGRSLTEEQWIECVHSALDVSAPFIILALTAIESEIAEVNDQRALIDDLVNPPGWNLTGSSRVVHVPEALGMAYHYVLGAFHLDNGRRAAAIELLQTPIRVATSGSSTTKLWRYSELIGWTHAIEHNCVKAWQLLVSIYAQHDWLQPFFVAERDYVFSLRSYQVLASLVELAAYIDAGGTKDGVPESTIRLDVPPMFLVGPGSVQDIPAIVQRAALTRETLDNICVGLRATADQIRDFWPYWFRALAAWHFRDGRLLPEAPFRSAPPLLATDDYVDFSTL